MRLTLIRVVLPTSLREWDLSYSDILEADKIKWRVIMISKPINRVAYNPYLKIPLYPKFYVANDILLYADETQNLFDTSF